jgi:two-component system sensor histidine kinase MprB
VRRRVGIVSGLAVAIAVLLASLTAYALVREAMYNEIDRTLRERAVAPPNVGVVAPLPGVRVEQGLSEWFVQAVPNGASATVEGGSASGSPLPGGTTPPDRIAAGSGSEVLRTAEVGGRRFRTLTRTFANGTIEIARPLDETDGVLGRLRLLFGLLIAAGAAAGALFGRLLARPAVRPVERLAEAAEEVRSTGDLSRRVDATGRDELGRLGASFNAMLGALEVAQDRQRRLVADASHELRTPITSLRTNIEVLRTAELDATDADGLMGDVVAQLDELTAIVADVLELARGDAAPGGMTEEVRLDEVTARVVEQMRIHAREIELRLSAEPTTVQGDATRLAHAVRNLVTNALEWSPSGGVVEVTVEDNVVSVADRGPGIDPAEAGRLFERFYRAPAARGRPGSGLGLAIVSQVAESHGATATIRPRPGGGAVASLAFAPEQAPWGLEAQRNASVAVG